jgi:hypothetical protein
MPTPDFAAACGLLGTVTWWTVAPAGGVKLKLDAAGVPNVNAVKPML